MSASETVDLRESCDRARCESGQHCGANEDGLCRRCRERVRPIVRHDRESYLARFGGESFVQP
jgi:hypothetical protein